MAAFILASAIAFVTYEFLAFSHFPRHPFGSEKSFNVADVTVTFDSTAERWGRRVLRGILAAAILVVVLLIHQYLFPGSIIERSRTTIILGFVFGPLFAVWVNSIFAHPPGRALTKGQVIGGIGLIVFFIVGVLGNEAGSVVSRWARSINKIALPGAELSFSESARKPQPLTSSFSAMPSGHANVSPSDSGGLSLLTNVDSMVERDCRYTAQATTAPSACGNWNDFKPDHDFAKLAVSSYARCLGGILSETADIGFVNDRLAALAPRYREINALDGDRKKLVDRVVRTFYRQLVQLAAYVLPSFPQDAKDLPKASARPIPKSCQEIMAVLCIKEQSPATPSGNAEEAWLRAWLDDGNGDPAKVTLLNPAHVDEIKACSSNVIGIVANNAAAKPADEALSSLFRSRVVSTINKYIGDVAHLRLRPYMAIAYAGAMTHLSHAETALVALYQWTAAYEASRSNGNSPKAESGYRNWLVLRVRSSMAWIAEDRLRGLGPSAPLVMREMHLENLQKLIDLIVQLDGSAAALRVLEQPKYHLRNTKFDSLPDEDLPTCSYHDHIKPVLLYVYLTNKLAFAYNALSHPRYDRDFALTARTYVEDVMNADMACVGQEYGRSESYLKLRSDALDLEAQILYRAAISSLASGSDDQTLDMLRLARAAATLGLRRIDSDYQEIRDKKRASTDVMEKLSSSLLMETYESLQRTLDTINQAIQQVSG